MCFISTHHYNIILWFPWKHQTLLKCWDLMASNHGLSYVINSLSSPFTVIFLFDIEHLDKLALQVIFLSLTSTLVFALPADAGEKISMGITVLLAYAVYLTIVSEHLPNTSVQVSPSNCLLLCYKKVTVKNTSYVPQCVCLLRLFTSHHSWPFRSKSIGNVERWVYLSVHVSVREEIFKGITSMYTSNDSP